MTTYPRSLGKLASLSLIGFALASVDGTRAHAGPGLNCDAYAKSALDQAKEGQARGCKFTGSLWAMDYNGHKNWCLSPGIKMENLTWGQRERGRLLDECKTQSNEKFQAHFARQKQCLQFAKEARDLRVKLNKACPSSGEWPVTLKTDVDHCMKKGGANFVKIENVRRVGKIAECQLQAKKASLAQTKTFPHSGKKGTRRNQWLPVDVCLRQYYKDGSWVFGLGGGITDVPPSWGCGKKVADAFCITNGYVEAIKYPIKTYDNGSNMDGRFASTYWIGSKKACHGKCAGFSSITCQGKL